MTRVSTRARPPRALDAPLRRRCAPPTSRLRRRSPTCRGGRHPSSASAPGAPAPSPVADTCTAGASSSGRSRARFRPSCSRPSHSSKSTCALGASGSLFCWGASDERHQRNNPRSPILRVREVPPLAAIALDDDRSCGVTRAGKIVCWERSTAPDQLGFASKPGRCHQGCWEPPTALSGLVVDVR